MAENQKNQGGQGQGQSKENDTSKRGFASMDEEKQREIASKGGKASHGGDNDKGDENKGETDTSKRGFASMDEEKQREIARKGGKASHDSGNKDNKG